MSCILQRETGILLHQLDDGHLGSVAAANTDAGHSRVAAIAVGILRSEFLEDLVRDIFLRDEGQSLTVSGQVVLLGQKVVSSLPFSSRSVVSWRSIALR